MPRVREAHAFALFLKLLRRRALEDVREGTGSEVPTSLLSFEADGALQPIANAPMIPLQGGGHNTTHHRKWQG